METDNGAEEATAEKNYSHTETLREKFEREHVTRRQALARFGFGSAAAVLAALSVDDLARMAARQMERRAGENEVALSVARELRNTGVAFSAQGGPGEDEPVEIDPVPATGECKTHCCPIQTQITACVSYPYSNFNPCPQLTTLLTTMQDCQQQYSCPPVMSCTWP